MMEYDEIMDSVVANCLTRKLGNCSNHLLFEWPLGQALGYLSCTNPPEGIGLKRAQNNLLLTHKEATVC